MRRVPCVVCITGSELGCVSVLKDLNEVKSSPTTRRMNESLSTPFYKIHHTRLLCMLHPLINVSTIKTV